MRVGDSSTVDVNSLLNALENYEIGETVDVTVDRHGQTEIVRVTLQAIE